MFTSSWAASSSSFAASGRQLAEAQLISPEFGQAFESHLGNGDQFLTPKAGYVYRVLFGTADEPLAFVINPDAPPDQWQLSSFGFTNRPSIPGTSGENQFFITEAGTVYKKEGKNTAVWLLSDVPPPTDRSWTPAK